MRRRLVGWGAILALAAVYFCAGKFGLSLASLNASASAVWPPSGIALAAVLLGGYRLWPGILLGAFLVNITTQGSVMTTAGVAVGNTLEVVSAAWLVHRFAGGLKAFERARNIFKFVLLAAMLSPMLSATFGVTSLCLGHFARWHQYSAIWLTWWLGDMVSDLTIAPLLLVCLARPFIQSTPKRIPEEAGLLLTVALVGSLVFFNPFAAQNYPLEYLAILPLLWAAFRFGQRGAVTSAFVMSGVALWGTVHGFGPFARSDANESLLLLQAFMGTTTLTALVLASVVAERQRAEQRLHVQYAVSRVLAEARTLTEATPKILRALCEVGGWEVGALWRVDRPANEICCVEVWQLPSIEASEFEAISRRQRFAPGIGLPGRVWTSGRPAWVADVTKDSNFPRASVATKEGLRAAFCFPLKLGHEIVGVIECFSHQVREPDDNFREMLDAIGSQLGQFIERTQAEESLLQSQEQERARRMELETLMEAVPAAVWIAHDTECRRITGNQAGHEMLRMPRGANLSKTAPEPERPQHFQVFRNGRLLSDEELPLQTVARTGKPLWGWEEETRFSDLTSRWLYGNVVPLLNESGAVRGVVATFIDITERKLAEQALQEAKEQLSRSNEELEQRVHERTAQLRETNSQLEAFVYSIAHDLRAPLRAMEACSKMLLDDCGPRLDPTGLEYARRINASAVFMDRLLLDLLEYGRTARAELELAPVKVEAAWNAALFQCQDQIQEKHAHLQLVSSLPAVRAHEATLGQMLANLLSNALRFVALEVRPEIRFWAEERPHTVRLWLEDNGIGIAPEHHRRVFRIFERLHGATYGGTGIGLAIVRKGVERMGGSVGLESALGTGSRFWIELPRA